eukprot:15141539-Alexandrium_andersonii.AAC.1
MLGGIASYATPAFFLAPSGGATTETGPIACLLACLPACLPACLLACGGSGGGGGWWLRLHLPP